MNLKNIFSASIANKIILLLAAAVLPILLIIYFLVMPIIENNYLESRKKELKSVVESAYSILEIYNNKAENGLLTIDEAKEQAISDINALRYSGKEYYFVYDMDGVVMALGSAPEKKGENRLNVEDNMGNRFVADMIRISRNKGDGFVTYYYPKLGETVPSPKLSYFKLFGKWNCFIGSGLYIDDIEASISEVEKDILFPLIAFLVVIVVIGIFLPRKISKPLKRIASISNEIAAGNFAQKFDPKDIELKDEVGQLAKSLSTMVKTITDKVFWYEQILDTIPYPISVTDNNMKWTFVNKAVEDLLKVKREKLVGTHCSNMNATICNTKNCGVQRLKDGYRDTYFEQFGKNFNIDTSYLKDTAGNTTGNVEVLIDITEIKSMENYLAEGTNKMLTAMNRFADGDLNVSLNVEKDDDVGRLFAGFNKSVENIKALITNVSEAVHATASASTQISSSTEEMAAGAQEQSSQTNDVAAAVEQMAKTIIETTRNATKAADHAKKAGEIAGEGGRVVEETVNGMQKIAEVVLQSSQTVKQLGNNSSQIGEIIQVIDDIADQTNLLALNAAIEAARAGEQGRGFAVVADEVRKLAERTTKATKEIAVMIKQIQNDTEEAVSSMDKGTEEVERGRALANKAGESLRQIISASYEVVDDITQVAAASEQQSTTAEQISSNIDSINNVANETSAGIQQVAHSAEDLNRLTENLQKLVSRFNIGFEKKGYSYIGEERELAEY